MNMKFRICILTNGTQQDHERWISAIEKSGMIESFDLVDLTGDKWLQEISLSDYDLFILRPPGKTEIIKRVYDERAYLINQYFKIPVYPSLTEVLIYENKRFLRDWLSINDMPHPETFVFYSQDEAIRFVKRREIYPLVGKTNIGASGSGVVILNTREDTEKYIKTVFSSGIRPAIGPKIFKGSILKKIKKILNNKNFIRQRIKDYMPASVNLQYFVILQEYVEHSFEWRCVRIGDSFFAHKKIAKGGKASGHLVKEYSEVSPDLLNYIKEMTDKLNLKSVSIDLFERQGSYLINEIQCYFGQSDPYQMLVMEKPGRYKFENGKWIFEEGMFNTNQSYDLRLEHALSLLRER